MELQKIKVGIVGLGDIAKKAYLPVITSRSNIEIHICSKDEIKLSELAIKYRIPHTHSNLDTLISTRPDCIFVHAATDAHYNIVKQILLADIHVFVDKPISMHYAQSAELVVLAEARKLIFMVGFNRRYAPSYARFKEESAPSMIIMQKNRKTLADELRRFVVEDFIHVVDTLRNLFPYPIDQLLVNGMKKDTMLHHLSIQFIAPEGQTAIGIMNRDSGATEEKLEFMNHEGNSIVYNVNDVEVKKNKDTLKIGDNDWQSTLYKRGFDLMIDDFLNAVRTNGKTKVDARDALKTHEVCERIVEMLLK